ncbi:MAG: serine protease [Candidatus Aramenus sp.]|jgi:uncharacterized protein|nr:serine protease [Candidatus Aramenus sp.]
MKYSKSIFIIVMIILIIIAGISGFLAGKYASPSKNSATTTVENVTYVKQVSSSDFFPPAGVGNTEDYLINPVFPAHTIAGQYAYVTQGNGRVFIGGLYYTGNGYLAGAKGAAVVASMLAYQPLTQYDYYLYITAPSTINVGGAVKTDSATVMYLASMLGQVANLNKSMYFLGDVGLEGYMYSTGVVYQRIVQLYQGGIYYLVVPQMMALAEGQNFQMAEHFAKEHNITLLTAESIPQMYQLETSYSLSQPVGYMDLQYNASVGYQYLSAIYHTLLNESANQTAKEMAKKYWAQAESLANEGNYTAFYFLPNPAVSAIQVLYNNNYNLSMEVQRAVGSAISSMDLWKIETAAEADYLFGSGNLSEEILAEAWASLSLSINVGPTITPYGLYQGLYNEYVTDVYAAEYYDAVTGSNYGNVTLLNDVLKDPNVVYDYGFFSNYYSQLALNFSYYFLKQLNSTSQSVVKSSIYSYMVNEDKALQDAAAYYDAPSIVGEIAIEYGTSAHNLAYLYLAMPFVRFTMNTEQLTWYASV